MFRLFAFVCLLLLSTTANAQMPQRWQMAIGEPETNYLGRIMKDFVEEVNNNSNGQLYIQLHPRGSLLTQPHIMRAVRTGQIQIGSTLLALHGNEDPFFEVEGIPFLADTWEDTIALQRAAEPYIRSRLDSRGVTLLYSIPWTSQGFYTNTPINNLQDLRGLRLRIYNPVTSRMASLMGASPVNIVAAEVPQAFVSNIINAMFTSAQTGVDFAAWDYSKVFTDVGGMRNRAIVIVNTNSLGALSPEVRELVMRAAARANSRGFDEARKVESTSLEALRANRMQTPTPSAELMRGLRSIGTQLTGEWVVRAGPEGAQFMARYRELQSTRAN